MEVHHHTHSEMPGHRKKWTHYFWEFLMLFLAVFCGFMAENFREHQIEHKREKQYMVSLIADLKNDTTNLLYGFPLKASRIAAMDSVFLFFENNPNISSISGSVHRQILRIDTDLCYSNFSNKLPPNVTKIRLTLANNNLSILCWLYKAKTNIMVAAI